MKRIVMTGGGSSGHVTPNIALIPRLVELGYQIHYIGSKNGMEKPLIEKEGIPYHSISAGKLRRYLDLENFIDIFRVLDGVRQSVSILRKLKPSIVFSKGGFVSCPVVWAAWLCKIPVVIHESDMTPGLTNRLSMPFASKVCYTFPESGHHIPGNKGVPTGIPIRQALYKGKRERGLKRCGFSEGKPVIMVMGGSQGAESINSAVRNALPVLLREFQICHICGKGNVNPDFSRFHGYRQFEYSNEEQPDLYAAADLLVSRAGATSLFEILALRKPNLLIPLSRKASRGDQILNAGSFERQGFSQVLLEENLTEENLIDGIRKVHRERDVYIRAMSRNEEDDGVNKICAVLEECRRQ